MEQAPQRNNPIDTAGLKCAPEICPNAYIITMRVAAIANGARVPPEPRTAAINIVIVRKKVPMNSEAIFAFDVGVVMIRPRKLET